LLNELASLWSVPIRDVSKSGSEMYWYTVKCRRTFALLQWRPVPLLEDVALLEERWHPSDHYENAVIRRPEMSALYDAEYAIGGGAPTRRSHLFRSSLSRLRHERMQRPVPICSELIFESAAGRHKLSDTDRSLDARPSPSRGRGRLQIIVPLPRMPCRRADSDVTS
jgi:hypothetical protein